MTKVYGVHYWNRDKTDVGVSDTLLTLDDAIKEVKHIKGYNRGYCDFTIYAYHAELVNRSFIEDGRVYKHQEWEKIYDDFEQYFDEEGNES